MEHNCTLLKVLEVFCLEPMRMHYIKEIAKKIKLAPTSVRIHIKHLLANNLITKRKGDIFTGYLANRDNEEFIFYKKVLNIIRLKESGLIKSIVDLVYPESIVLFGSYSKGEDIESSDIDLLIITKEKKELKLENFEIYLKRKIHIISQKSLKNSPKELKEEVINGIVLYGYLKDG